MKVFVALGSNLGVPFEHLNKAFQTLESRREIQNLHVSRWYKTAPIGGPIDQPDYTNAACCFDSTLNPAVMLAWLQHIELAAGRERKERWGPRTLDLDIIWMENFFSDTPELTVPHPRAHERAFVIQPLLDLGAKFHLAGQPLTHWLNQTSDQAIEPIDQPIYKTANPTA